MVFVYRVISMDDLIWFCNYVCLSWLLYIILCWSLSVLSCWDKCPVLLNLSHRPAGNCCTRPPYSFEKQHSTMIWLTIDPKTSYEIDWVGQPIIFPNIHPFQPEFLSPTFTHWVLCLGIYATEMINPLCKHCASSNSIFIVSVQDIPLYILIE